MNFFLVLERIVWVSIISYGEIRFDIRVLGLQARFRNELCSQTEVPPYFYSF
jgi:hypothetical protein